MAAFTLVVGRFLTPMEALTRTVSKPVPATEFKPIVVSTRDEVGALSEAFNRMFGIDPVLWTAGQKS